MARHAPQSRESPKGFDRLIVAGLQDGHHRLYNQSILLPTQLADRVAAVVPAESFASGAEILEMTLEIERGVERHAEERLVDGSDLQSRHGHGRRPRGASDQASDRPGGEVDVVHNAAARRLSEACNGIGGLLRFGQI